MAKSRKKRRPLAVILRVVISVLIVFVLIAGIYVAYVSFSYKRTGDIELVATANTGNSLETGIEYSALTFNIGFGAYSPDFSFFMDGGKYATAKNKDEVIANTNGAIDAVNAQNADFVLIQEIDTEATRSKKVNQLQMFDTALGVSGVNPQTARVFAKNSSSEAYLAYPFNDPIGIIRSGIATYSKYPITSAERKGLPITTKWPAKLFDLDRCISICRLPVDGGGKELVLINAHLSAYDEGGVFRKQQLDFLAALLETEKAAGNYVIVGGDFNHDLTAGTSNFQYSQSIPDWCAELPDFLPAGFSMAFDSTVPTCRSTDIEYTKGVNFLVVLDGFIVSDNITATATGIDINFANSDHQPVKLTFTLN